MLCCLLFAMLVAQAAALLRRGREWLGVTLCETARAGLSVPAGLWRRRRLAAFVAVQLVAMMVVFTHRDHLLHELRFLTAAGAEHSAGLIHRLH